MFKVKSKNNSGGNKKKLYLSVKEAAAYTGVSEYHIRKFIKEKKIPYVETGVKFLINRIALKEYLKGLEQ
ncbi:MAG: excisionase family DNA-binding protein [Clostridia bacterium]|nr:excisionase family DNA-binding protein [Clostridia bacterium]MCI9086465.1 excisionase family DNA-binding protein [Clostridia bacterium]